MNQRSIWLGQVPLRRGPSASGSGLGAEAIQGTAPYYGEWGVLAGGVLVASGKAGPFDTQDEAFGAAIKEARKAGAKTLPTDGYARVIDSVGQPVGPTT